MYYEILRNAQWFLDVVDRITYWGFLTRNMGKNLQGQTKKEYYKQISDVLIIFSTFFVSAPKLEV